MTVAVGLVLCVGALALRTVGPFGWVVAACGGVVALAVPVSTRIDSRTSTWVAATSVGILAVGGVGLLVPSGMSATRWGIAAAAVAGVAEEAIFRRGLYGLLERWGAVVAIVVPAVAFGLVHVPVYGWRVLGLDVAAGLVFGWQRWVSGHWSSPAATHAVANVVAYI